MQYGRYQFDDEIDSFLQTATENDLNVLAQIAERVQLNKHQELIDDFLDEYAITEYSESAKLYFMFGVIDAADVTPEDDSWNTVYEHIKSLQKHGSYRKASERMWAARFLADFGPEAKPAIPFLEIALKDDDLRVQIWSHFALAKLIGDREIHKQAINTIFAQHQNKDEFGDFDEIGMEAEEALEKLFEANP